MPISQEDKQKYIDYLKSRGKALPKGLSNVTIEFEDGIDPIVSIVESIFEQFKSTFPEDYSKLSEDDLVELKSNIYAYILSEGFAAVLEVEEGTYSDPGMLTEANEIDDVEAMLAFIYIKSTQEEKVAENFTKGLFKGYYEYCEQRDLPTDNCFKENLIK